ncbi:hypothetical protein [Armatimonas sp.]|uniref:hypothetical protein n=1 Tax=Armatimonas sp. TaxID=1872638 RepID=UPI00286CA8FC|nr:hypothetical protein [Armatimonas sp.]
MSAATLHILEEASTLPVLELDALIAHLAELRARKATMHQPPPREIELIQQINQCVPLPLREHWQELILLQQNRILTMAEATELAALVDSVEEREAERAGLLAELARLRGVTVLQLVETLGLRPRDREMV